MLIKYYLDGLIDLRYGGYFGGTRKTPYEHLGAHDTASSFYFVLSRVFGQFPVKPSDVLVDVGCGKGRVINWWLRKGYTNRIVGIELDGEIAAGTRRTFRKRPNVEIVHGNALNVIPPEGTIFYLYNPFNREVTVAFRERLKQVCSSLDRVRIYYANCEFLDAFTEDPFWTVRSNSDLIPETTARPVLPLDIGIDYPVAVIEKATAPPS